MDTEKTVDLDFRRLTVLGLCLTFGLAIVVAQLIRYQVLMHSDLKQVAEEQRERTTDLPSVRGYIADANGRILAMNTNRWDISVSPVLITDPAYLASVLASALALDGARLRVDLRSDKAWLPLAQGVPQKLGEAIAGLQIHGLICKPQSTRNYPMSDLVSHATGFVNHTGNGFYGVEGYYNPALKGLSGTKLIEIDPFGIPIPRPIEDYNPPEPGANLILTLDLNIQNIAETELSSAIDQFKAESGTVIVMDPKTGALLAVASLPSFDPNQFASAEPSLLADPSVSGMWEPGSIFKIMTWGAGLDSGAITPEMTVFDEGRIEVGGRIIENSDRKAHGKVSMTEALAHSLNTVAAYVSTTMGKDQFYNYLRRFGFGNLTGVDLASEGPGRMKLPGDSDWFPSELGTNSFGQGIAATPMQMITAVAAVANQGILMRPHIVQQRVIEDRASGRPRVTAVEPVAVRAAISAEAAATLTDMLVEVVEREATKARIRGYRIAGKTGTAQIPTAVGYHPTDTIVSFVGYAPADDPVFIILVKLDRPKASRWAAHTAAPAFRAIAQRLLVYRQIPPDEIRLAQH